MHFCTRLAGNTSHRDIVSPPHKGIHYIQKDIFLVKCLFLYLGKVHQDDQRLNNLFYRKSKLESVNETSALLSGFAIVRFYSKHD
jgi:hypothetical protein